MSELYRKNQDLLSEDDKYGHDYKSKKFNAVFGTYDNSMPFIHVLIKILAILFLFFFFLSMLLLHKINLLTFEYYYLYNLFHLY